MDTNAWMIGFIATLSSPTTSTTRVIPFTLKWRTKLINIASTMDSSDLLTGSSLNNHVSILSKKLHQCLLTINHHIRCRSTTKTVIHMHHLPSNNTHHLPLLYIITQSHNNCLLLLLHLNLPLLPSKLAHDTVEQSVHLATGGMFNSLNKNCFTQQCQKHHQSMILKQNSVY